MLLHALLSCSMLHLHHCKGHWNRFWPEAFGIDRQSKLAPDVWRKVVKYITGYFKTFYSAPSLTLNFLSHWRQQVHQMISLEYLTLAKCNLIGVILWFRGCSCSGFLFLKYNIMYKNLLNILIHLSLKLWHTTNVKKSFLWFLLHGGHGYLEKSEKKWLCNAMQCLYLDWNKKNHQKNIFRKMNVNVKFIKLILMEKS